MKSQLELDWIVSELRERHPELRERLTTRTIRRVIDRDGIPRKQATLPVPAMTVTQYGRAAIVFDKRRLPTPGEEVSVLAEEFAHATLHAGERGEATIHLSSCSTDDPREYEADYLARCLIMGPGVFVEYRTPRPRRRSVAQKRAFLLLEDPITKTTIQLPAEPLPFVRSSDPYETAFPLAVQVSPRDPVPQRRSRASGKNVFVQPGRLITRPVEGFFYYSDPDGLLWRIWDVYATLDLGTGKILRRFVKMGSEIANARYFQGIDVMTMETGEVRFYRFGKGEGRELHVRHLDRQIRQTSVVRSKHATSSSSSERVG